MKRSIGMTRVLVIPPEISYRKRWSIWSPLPPVSVHLGKKKSFTAQHTSSTLSDDVFHPSSSSLFCAHYYFTTLMSLSHLFSLYSTNTSCAVNCFSVCHSCL